MILQSASLFLLLVLAVPDALPYEFQYRVMVDEACTALGGKCLDWRYNKCTAGYVAGKCSGDTNIKCCLPCDTTCLNNEVAWYVSDSQCKLAGGNCMLNSNFCSQTYQSGKCGGPANRQCCVPLNGNGRAVSQAGYNLIKGFEGLSLTAYQDIGGIWTIGYGNTHYEDGAPVKKGDSIIQARADSLFAFYVDLDFAPAVDRLVGNGMTLKQQMFDALVSFTYNVGTNAFGGSTLLKKVKVNPSDPTIRDEFMKWVNVNGKVSKILVNRRTKEADFYFSQ